MSDALADELIRLSCVPRYIRAPSPPHLSTVMRWVLRGVGQPPVKLATVKVGGRRYTTRAAIDAFIVATSQQTVGAGPLPGARQATVRAAEHALDADGVA